MSMYPAAEWLCTVLREIALAFVVIRLLLWCNGRHWVCWSVRPQWYKGWLEELKGPQDDWSQAYIFLSYKKKSLFSRWSFAYCELIDKLLLVAITGDKSETCTILRWASDRHISHFQLSVYRTVLQYLSSLICPGSTIFLHIFYISVRNIKATTGLTCCWDIFMNINYMHATCSAFMHLI